MAEIGVRTFVQGFKYYLDTWNTADALIVIGSYVIGMNTRQRGFSVLRLLRLVRVVMVFRKVSASAKRKTSE